MLRVGSTDGPRPVEGTGDGSATDRSKFSSQRTERRFPRASQQDDQCVRSLPALAEFRQRLAARLRETADVGAIELRKWTGLDSTFQPKGWAGSRRAPGIPITRFPQEPATPPSQVSGARGLARR